MGPAYDAVSDTVFTGASLSNLVQRFWETEEVATVSRTDSLDVECERHFVENDARTIGYRVVGLLHGCPF